MGASRLKKYFFGIFYVSLGEGYLGGGVSLLSTMSSSWSCASANVFSSSSCTLAAIVTLKILRSRTN